MFVKFIGLKNLFKNKYLNVLSAIFALAVIGLLTVNDYGISYDELAPMNVPFINFDIISKGVNYPGHIKHYGTLFNLTSELVFRGQDFLDKKLFNSYANQEKDNLDRNIHPFLTKSQFLKRLKVKHILTFLLSLATYIAVAGIVSILAGIEYAWLGAIILALFPRFWGHSFFNPKDIPLAAMFSLGTFLGACLVGYYLQIEAEKRQLGMNRITLYSLGYGILVGGVAGTRVDGSILLFFVAITHGIVGLGRRSLKREVARFWKFYGLMTLAWMATSITLYPASWSNPVVWFQETWQFFYQEPWPLTVLLDGQFIPAESLPWYYLPKWLAITIPALWQITFGVGVLWLFWRYQKLRDFQRACAILVLLQIFFLPLIAILNRSTMYDGMRHFLYMLPGIAAICATTLAWVYQKISSKAVRIFALALIIALVSPIVSDMVTLHPYEYVYFNRVFGGLAKAQNRYETDYWGLSLREGMEWIAERDDSPATVVSSEPVFSAATLAAANIKVIAYKEFEPAQTARPFYYIAIPRWDFQAKFPECQVVHQVLRQGVPLTIVKKCD
jgi:hypothetical protein